jgi:hypothetical protein
MEEMVNSFDNNLQYLMSRVASISSLVRFFINSGNCWKHRARVHANPNPFDPKLSNTISLKNENTSNQVSNSMLKYNRFTVEDSATVRVITLVTLIYLPPTSVSVCLNCLLLRVCYKRLTRQLGY